MKRPYLVGLTGGMGAGKSTVVQRMKDLGLKHDASIGQLFDCDAEVHKLYNDPSMIALLQEQLGDVGDNPRQFCAGLIQKDLGVLDTLEALFIPALKKNIADKLLNTPYLFFVIDAPLLFETGLHHMCDDVVLVYCPESTRRQRIMARPNMTEAKMNLLLSRQWSDSKRSELASMVINTEGTLEETFRQTDIVFETIRKTSCAR